MISFGIQKLNPDDICKDTCSSNMYSDLSNICQECPNFCEACSSANNCTLCNSYTYINPDNTCKETCPNNYYKQDFESPATNKCKICYVTC